VAPGRSKSGRLLAARWLTLRARAFACTGLSLRCVGDIVWSTGVLLVGPAYLQRVAVFATRSPTRSGSN